MTNALDRVAQELQTELDGLGIKVPNGERTIIWGNLTVKVPFGTPKTDCRRKLKKIIKAAERAHLEITQSVLF